MAPVTLDKITKVYPNGFQAVTDLSLELEDGEFMVLVGPSGCGKSTALRMIAGLEDITDGSLVIDGKTVNEVEPKDRTSPWKQRALSADVSEKTCVPFEAPKGREGALHRQVQEAAEILELTEQLDKAWPAFGGQRQRVAMGRAIVRRPAVSHGRASSNLDAAAQTRADIAGIQRELGVTTFYVTHDQVEAMTAGDRVAVIKDGHLQQVDAPENLYANPDNVFVAAFIGSPSMNLFEGVVSRDGSTGAYSVQLGSQSIAVPTEAIEARPALASYLDQPVVVGIRPEDLDDAAIFPDHPGDQRIHATIDVREALGAETLVHFGVDAPHVDSGDPDALDELGDESSSRCTGRFSPLTEANVGETIQITVNASKFHFFDKTSHLAIRD